MSLALTVRQHWDDGKRLHVIGTLAASGNYATGGDTLSFADRSIKTTKAPQFAEIHGKADFCYTYVPGTTQANGKMLVRAMSTGAEASAAAYPAGVTADVIDVYAIFPKFR